MIVFPSFCGGGQPAVDVPARTNYNLRGHRSEVGGAEHVVAVDGDGDVTFFLLMFLCLLMVLLVVMVGTKKLLMREEIALKYRGNGVNPRRDVP